MPRYDRWTDQEAGPVVRPYALTGGRTDPAGDMVLDMMAVIATVGPVPLPAELAKLSPEQRKLLGQCQIPVTVVDAAADMDLPLGVVRVLLADLIQQGMITVLPRQSGPRQARTDLLKEVLDGLRSL
jgi:Protein of unknown function (DUF742)